MCSFVTDFYIEFDVPVCIALPMSRSIVNFPRARYLIRFCRYAERTKVLVGRANLHPWNGVLADGTSALSASRKSGDAFPMPSPFSGADACSALQLVESARMYAIHSVATA